MTVDPEAVHLRALALQVSRDQLTHDQASYDLAQYIEVDRAWASGLLDTEIDRIANLREQALQQGRQAE